MKSFSLGSVLAEISSDSVKRVYTAIFEAGPITGRELNDRLANPKAHSRIAELRTRGLIESAGRRPCPVTGKNVVTWRVTGNLPQPKVPKKQKARPTAADISAFAEQFIVLRAMAGKSGARISPEVKKVHEWLLAGAPCGHTN